MDVLCSDQQIKWDLDLEGVLLITNSTYTKNLKHGFLRLFFR